MIVKSQRRHTAVEFRRFTLISGAMHKYGLQKSIARSRDMCGGLCIVTKGRSIKYYTLRVTKFCLASRFNSDDCHPGHVATPLTMATQCHIRHIPYPFH